MSMGIESSERGSRECIVCTYTYIQLLKVVKLIESILHIFYMHSTPVMLDLGLT